MREIHVPYSITFKSVKSPVMTFFMVNLYFPIASITDLYNKKHLKNVGPIRHCEPPHALILHCHSPGFATFAPRLRIDVHNNNDNNNNDDDA